MTKIKICGLMTAEDIACVNHNHVDFAGFVLFCPKSKRNMPIARAVELVGNLSKQIKKVAVTVSPSEEQLRRAKEAGFDYIQIHGDVPEQVLRQAGIPVLKAFNGRDREDISRFRQPQVAGYVLDAENPGSGRPFDWQGLKGISCGGRLFILAGGLSAENVEEAIAMVRPDVVDVSSSVEYGDRQGKDPRKVEEFCRAVRNAE